jgi:hypothetical protein
MQLIAPAWPLQRWGIDIVGKLIPVKGNYTIAVMVVEYFTKWLEVKPLTNVTFVSIRKIFWQNIICLYGALRHIMVNNAKYFDNTMFKDFCQQIRMKVAFMLVYHPQTNDVVERANTLIFKAIKTILEVEKKDKWAEVMPQAVWSHNTTVCRATNFTPF